MNTPLTEQIMQLHKECMNKNATPANEYALRARVEKLERDRARLIETLKEMAGEYVFVSQLIEPLEADK